MAIKAYWWDDVPNWGDLLTPHLLAHHSDLAVKRVPVSQADVVSSGSVLEHIPPGWTGHIVGSGRLIRGSRLNLDQAQVHLVRGPSSAEGIKDDVALGDPGLIADEMVSADARDIELGLVPHWSDTELAHQREFAGFGPVVIKAFGDPLQVIRTIGRCKKIVASSLHGIILADAFGIPRRTEIARRFIDNPHEGGSFKFEDYNASVGLKFTTGEVQQPERGIVENRKHEIRDVFRDLRKLL